MKETDIKVKSRILWSARRQRKKILRIPVWPLSGEKQFENTTQSSPTSNPVCQYVSLWGQLLLQWPT